MNTHTCTTCGTQLKRHEAVLRGNAIDAQPTAWCRRDAVGAGILTLPVPSISAAPVVPAPRPASALRQRLAAIR